MRALHNLKIKAPKILIRLIVSTYLIYFLNNHRAGIKIDNKRCEDRIKRVFGPN